MPVCNCALSVFVRVGWIEKQDKHTMELLEGGQVEM